jgi:hypothetical protein
MTHPLTRKAGRRRPAPAPTTSLAEGAPAVVDRRAHDHVAARFGERRAGTTEAPQAPARPDAQQVWSWSASAVLSGYGPAASDFL